MSNIPLPPIGYSDHPGIKSRCSSRTSSAESPNGYSFRKGHNGILLTQKSAAGSSSRSSPRKLPSLRSTPTPVPHLSGSHTSRDMMARHSQLINRTGAASPYLQRSKSEDCLKCMLKVPHKKCEGHKYIRVGGGYRHSYWYVKAMLEEIELRKQRELIKQQRLDAIKEGHGMRAIKTYIRTKSGRLVEKVIWMTEDDYQAFQAGGADAEAIIKQYLSKDEARGLESWDKEEQKAITTWVRTKSGRLIQKTLYVSKDDYNKMKSGELDANDVLKKYMGKGEKLEGWEDAKMKAIKTFVRTKSGRLIEKTIMVSNEDYEKMMELKKQGKDPNSILEKYMNLEEGQKLEGWEKKESAPMKVVKAMVRTKSGRLVEKTILMTEEEYKQFLAGGGDPNFLKKFLDINPDDVIEKWEKASTVYSAGSDEELLKAKAGTRIKGKDGKEYEVVVDPITGKKYKRLVGGSKPTKKKKGITPGVPGGDPNEIGMTEAQKAAYRQGKRRDGSDSEFSYKSYVSDGGTRHVRRRRKRADGTYSDSDSYHSSQDEEGKKRRQKRRTVRKTEAIKKAQQRFKQGKRNNGSDSDYSYKSFVSDGGTRHVKRKKKRADGTYSASESYHSSQDEAGQKRRKARRAAREKAFKKGKRNPDSDSDFSYKSFVSAGGTRHVRRKKKNKDGTYGDSESYHSSQDEAGKSRRRKRRDARKKATKQGKRNADSDSDFSYKSYVSDGGTRHVRRRHKRADGTYSNSESYHSSQDEDGMARRRRRRRERKHGGSANSYYSVVSAGGTRHVKRRRRRADGTYSASESYHSDDSDHWEKKGRKKKGRHHGSDSDYSYHSEVSAGGTRRRIRKKKIRDKDGKVVGYEKAEEYSSDSDASYEMVSDGKGGFKKVLKQSYKDKKKAKNKKKGGGPDGDMTDFSDSLLSTDSEDEPDFSKMTEEEKQKYFEDKAKRKAERERKRKEKYGDKYEEMMEKHKKAKEAKKAYKSMVTYEKGGDRFRKEDYDNRDPGLGWEEYTDDKGRKVRRRKDSKGQIIEEYEDEHGRTIRRRTNKDGTVTEILVDDDGNVLKRITDKDGNVTEEYVDEKGRKVRRTVDADGNVVEEYTDENGNLVRRIKKGNDIIEEYVDKDGKTVRKITKQDGSEWEEIVDKDGKVSKRRIKSADQESLYEYERDADGNILLDEDGNPRRRKIGMIKKGKNKHGILKEDKDYIYKYDKDGNVVRIKKGDKEPVEVDNGDYFEIGEDGKMKLKAGKKKIDISKLTAEQLKALGIDLKNMSKEEIARILKEKFGDDIEIHKGGKKIGLKHIDDYGSDANTEDLANDSDLDITTLKGAQRFRVLMKRGGPELLEHIKRIIQESKLVDESNVHPDERDASIDFLQHYKLVEEKRVDSYARAFVVEDDDLDGLIYPREARLAIENVPSVKDISEKQLQYVLKLLDIDRETSVTFRMFSVMSALAERVTNMDKHCKKLLEISELSDIERKLALYKSMFYCNISSDHDPNFIQVDSLRIDLMAGGLNWKQQEYILGRLNPTEWDEISFLDYLAYIPLFMSMHDNMCDNPLDMSSNKYTNRQPSAAQRDENPLGQPLNRNSKFIETNNSKKDIHTQANNLLSGRATASATEENRDLFNRYQKLPHIASHSHPATAQKKH